MNQNAEGQERLLSAAAEAGLDLKLDGRCTHAELALKVWLADPKLLATKHNEQRLSRLATFEYFGSKHPVDRSDAFASPSQAVLDGLIGDLDAWFVRHRAVR